MVITIDIRTAGAARKLNKSLKAIQQAGEASAKELANLGRDHAKFKAPKYTGKTSGLIRVRQNRNQQGVWNYEVFAPNPTRNDGHIRRIANFNLVRWMHESPKALSHIRSGDPKFMYSTADFLNRMKRGVASKNFNKIKIRGGL